MTRRDLIFRVFVSSTFRDLIAERNALQEKAFPRLRDYCQKRGARFQAIDLRWGVSQEAALDQQTMRICFEELARCQQVSPKPNFIVLLGERYGWRPLPEQIPADEFEAILARVPEPQGPLLVTGQDVPPWRDGAAANRLGWYRKDLNAVPAEYVLQPRTVDFPKNVSDADKRRICRDEAEDWHRREADMHALLVSAIGQLGWAADDPRRQRYERSATHQEIDHGALHPGLDAEKHVFAYFREIKDAPADGSAAGFVDTGADRECLAALKGQLEHRLPPEHICRYEAKWQGDHPESDLDALCERVVQDLEGIIDAELKAFQQRPELEREKEAHLEFAQDRSRHFIGRLDVLARINAYLGDSQDNRPLVIHGVSGSGKTALMAHAWLTLTKPEQVVARFIGATPGSADLRSLLRSLCEQLGIPSPPSDMNELVKAFRERLAGSEKADAQAAPPARAVVFLDALDQLNPTDNARMLYWLPRELAPGVKLVVSALDAEGAAGECCDIARRIWPDRLVEVGALSAQDGGTLLETWLDDARRTLQDDQRRDVLDKFASNGRPLYLKVAFEEARRWRSWDGLPCGADAIPGLGDSVEGILADMLRGLEQPRRHGRLLVERALGSIAAAKNGLTEDELLDILSAEGAVMEDFLSRNPESPKVDRLPVVIWSRLRADLKPYMTERRADGTVVMNFYHRQVAEAVNLRYLATEDARLAVHVRLGDYFHKLDYWAESLEAQRARAKRLPPTPRPANVRKVVELPYHRLEAAKLGGKNDPKSPYWDAVADLLTDWQFLEAKAEADPNFREQPATEPAAAAGEAKP
ncbi:MAG TPA: DUF4062 domain-containing protein [Planctomycetota bacterium]|nr:DUF4062 domain-containing protein [Planctomycetota bacterium]